MIANLVDRPSVQVAGEAAKRGLIPRLPTAERLLADAETWLRAEYPDVVRALVVRALPDGAHRLSVGLHPAAGPLELTAADPARVTAQATTLPAGPGYHRFVGRLIARLGADLSIAWQDAPPGSSGAIAVAGAADPTGGSLAFADRATTERAYLGWLGSELIAARRARLAGRPGVPIGLPGDTAYAFDGAIATALGPRDDAWLEAAVADPTVAVEVAPWWADATDARHLLRRALCRMWLDVRWRRPAVEGEAETLDDVHHDLSRAYPLEPDLPYPWHDWAEVVSLRGIDDAMSRQVTARAVREPAPAVPIGYRRGPVSIVHEGWRLTVPGGFGERRTADEWWGGAAGRSVTLAAVETGTDIGPMTASEFLGQVAADLGPEALDHHAGEVVGRARLTTDASSGVEVGVLEGYSAVRGRGAAIRIVFDDSADWQWALDLWRSLAPA